MHRRPPSSSIIHITCRLLIGLVTAQAVHAQSLLTPGESDPVRSRQRMFAICAHVYSDLKPGELGLTSMERRLVCGDPVDDSIGRPWSQIPPVQAAFFMRAFLQVRARHRPLLTHDGDDLFVRAGPESRLKSFAMRGVPAQETLPKKREILDRPLNPKLLDELSSWATSEMRHRGYPCGSVAAEADPDDGSVQLSIEPNERKRVLGTRDVTATGLADSVLDRYSAYRVGSWYDQRLVDLTRRRTLEDSFLETISLNSNCLSDGVWVDRDAILGPPRQVKFGLGATTEEGLRVRAQLRYLRLDERASQAQARINASFRRRTLEAYLRWRPSNNLPRSYLEPSVRYDHEVEPQFDSQTTTARLAYGWNFEFSTGSSTVSLGPTWQETFLSRGFGPDRQSYWTADGQVSWQSHSFEYFQSSPREGTQADIQALVTRKSWGAGFTAQRISTSGQWLWNIEDFDPPLFVLAARWKIGTTYVGDDSRADDLPLRFRYFQGGINDLRGFGRQSLPGGPNGALTQILGGLEGRFYRGLLGRADPFVFFDAGKLGGANAQIDPALYWSPGLGVRYESPVGVFRGFIAYGFIETPVPTQAALANQWHANLTYGEEF